MGNKNEKKKEKKFVKLLLLGSGESGKSTFFKQIKLIHSQGYSEEEIVHYKSAICANVILTAKTLCQIVQKNNQEFENPENKKNAVKIIELGENDSLLLNAATKYTLEVHKMIDELWKDAQVQEAFKHRYEFHVFDGAEYFFNNLKKLVPPNYVPDQEDILRCRRKTIGIVELQYSIENTDFTIVDVGGQRNERKKWVNCFKDVTAVIFVSALSDYDQKCYEDDETNRLQESLNLFKEIANGEWFNKTTIMLVLNKLDVFKQKITKSPLKSMFNDYEDGEDVDKAVLFIEKKFRAYNNGDQGRIYPHLTCATSFESVKKVFNDMNSKIIELNLGTTL